MSSSKKEPLEDLAEGLSDGIAIDWEQARTEHAENLPRLQALELLETVGKTFHSAAATPTCDAKRPILFQWGPLDVLERLDEGSYGEVYRAIDRQLERPVALKLRKESIGDSEADWIAEGRRLAKLRHPNVLTVHGVASHDGRVGLWTELLASANLRQQLTEAGPLSPEELVAVGGSVCEALTAIHEAGMVHGDVKASNVVREKDGHVVLLDFGSSTDLSPVSGGSQGSPLTTAPEVLQGDPPTPAADLYSLGAMLYLLATGKPPIETDQYEELQHRAQAGLIPSLGPLRPDLPDAFTAAVHQALAVDTDHRFSDAKAFATALHESARTDGARTERSEARRSALGRPIAALSMLCLAIGLVTTAWWVLESGTASSRFDVRADLIRAGEPSSPLADGATVVPGDQLAMQVELKQPTHLYLINQDEKGESFVLFPLPAVEPQNPLPAGSHRLPGQIAGQSQNWVVTSTGGSETFLVIASASPLPAVEEFLEKSKKAGGGRAGARSDESPLSKSGEREIVGGDDTWEAVRGVGGLTQSGTRPTQSLEDLRREISEIDQDVWLHWVRLDNPL